MAADGGRLPCESPDSPNKVQYVLNRKGIAMHHTQPMRMHHHQSRLVRVIHILLITVCVVLGLFAVVALDAGEGHATVHTTRLDVNRHKVVMRSTLPHCDTDDPESADPPCTWNVGTPRDGNGHGLSYWVNAHHNAVYVWADDPTAPSPDHGYRRWVWSALADALAEGMGRHAGTRNWQACWVNTSPHRHPVPRIIRIGCPNGQLIRAPRVGPR